MTQDSVYEDRITIFLDILGFRGRIKKSEKDPKVATQIHSTMLRLRTVLSQTVGPDIQTTMFSDCICISIRSGGSFGAICAGLGLFSVAMLGFGFPIRGALTKGQLFHEGSTVFGPALVEAYELESRVAIYPRIILDPRVDLRLEEDAIEFEPIRTDFDGMKFVNFLAPIPLAFGLTILGENIAEMKTIPISAIETLKQDASGNPSAMAKIGWLESYILSSKPISSVPRERIDKLIADSGISLDQLNTS